MYQAEGVTKSARRQRRERLLVNGVLDDSVRDNAEEIAEESHATDVNISTTESNNEGSHVETHVVQSEPPSHAQDIQTETPSQPIQKSVGTQASFFWFLVLCIGGGSFIAGVFYFLKHMLHP